MPSSGAPDSPLTISCFVSSSRSSHRSDLNIPRDYFLSEIEYYVGSDKVSSRFLLEQNFK